MSAIRIIRDLPAIVFVFALLTVLSAALFTADLLGYFNIARKPVAYLDTSVGDIGRLAKDQLLWDRAKTGTLFGAGDTISSGEDARAKLVFYAGGELDLDAGTMVVLGDSVDELKLNFLRGGGSVKVAKNVKSVVKGSSRVHVAKVEHFTPRAHETPDQLVGQAVVAPPAVKESAIRNPDRTLAAVSRAGELVSAKRLPPVPEVKYPSGDAVIDLALDREPRLEWEVPASAKSALKYEVTVRPAEGQGEARVLKTDKPELSIARLPRGKYLWSVRAVDAHGNRSPATLSRWLEVRVPSKISKPTVLPVKVE